MIFFVIEGSEYIEILLIIVPDDKATQFVYYTQINISVDIVNSRIDNNIEIVIFWICCILIKIIVKIKII